MQEITKTLEIPQEKFQQIIKFLTEADMIQYNLATNQMRLNQNWKTHNKPERTKSAAARNNSHRHNNNTTAKNFGNSVHLNIKSNKITASNWRFA